MFYPYDAIDSVQNLNTNHERRTFLTERIGIFFKLKSGRKKKSSYHRAIVYGSYITRTTYDDDDDDFENELMKRRYGLVRTCRLPRLLGRRKKTDEN